MERDYRKEFEENLKSRLHVNKYSPEPKQSFIDGAGWAFDLLRQQLKERDTELERMKTAEKELKQQ